MKRIAFSVLALSTTLFAADFQAGVGRRKITPPTPIWLAGFGARTHPADGVLTDLWAKALAVEDSGGYRLVIVTTDLVGLPRNISDVVAARAQRMYGLERAQVLFNSSHTHSGPQLVTPLHLALGNKMSPDLWRRSDDYSDRLIDNLTAVIGEALADLKPASISYGHGSAGFAVNRRERTEKGWRIGPNPNGPTDHEVPLLEVRGSDGKLRAVLFGYACHNTSLTADNYKVAGDYAGFAQIEIEKAHPGATALFMLLCGADQNAYPRGTVELSKRYGAELAAEVNRVLSTKLKPVHGRIRSAFLTTELPFAPQSRESYAEQQHASDEIIATHAREMLRLYDEGFPPLRRLPYMTQAVRFGAEVTLVALSGEVVVDYALRVKREYGAEGMIVAGYCNEVMTYIPSLRILKEGGYEGHDAILHTRFPGPFGEGVEEAVFDAIHQLLKLVGRTS